MTPPPSGLGSFPAVRLRCPRAAAKRAASCKSDATGSALARHWRGAARLTQHRLLPQVCVMLRLLEYYTGILFLTTNRVESLDPAFQSRVQCALRYDALDSGSRAKIWADLLSRTAGGGSVRWLRACEPSRLSSPGGPLRGVRSEGVRFACCSLSWAAPLDPSAACRRCCCMRPHATAVSCGSSRCSALLPATACRSALGPYPKWS